MASLGRFEVQHRPRQESYQRSVGQGLQAVGDLFVVGVFAGGDAGFLGKFADGRGPPGVPASDFKHRLEQRRVAPLGRKGSVSRSRCNTGWMTSSFSRWARAGQSAGGWLGSWAIG